MPTEEAQHETIAPERGLLASLIAGALHWKLAVAVVTLLLAAWGVYVAPFPWDLGMDRDPVPVDAIPDIGENQQIVFTAWPGRSPRDVEDQVTYPLTTALLGIPSVRTVRSFSMMGFSTAYVVFDEEADFYWSRARIIEKLASLPANTLPPGVSPQLGPDATSLGQVFWYTLEGRTPDGDPVGGWDLDELRSIQDFYVRPALASADDVAEVASVGGYVREYQVDVDPDAMRAFGVSLQDVYRAVRESNAEVGAQTTEINGVEYLIRGVGFVRSADDLREAVVASREDTAVRVSDVAHVHLGPAARRGVLDKNGVQAVGGVVTARFGSNPMVVIDGVHDAIDRLAPSLPRRTLEDGRVSQVTIVPFYDRSTLIQRTLGTLRHALYQQILITILVVLVLMLHLRSSLLVAGLLPLAVLFSFVAMKLVGVDANVVSLAGIAIAIGTLVDVGIVITENVVAGLEEAPESEPPIRTIARSTHEVAGAVLTAVATTVISFLPVFMLEGAEGKLFAPLAYTKTFALIASGIIAVFVIPPAAWLLLGLRLRTGRARWVAWTAVAGAGLGFVAKGLTLLGLPLLALGIARLVELGMRLRSSRSGEAPPRWIAAGWPTRAVAGSTGIALVLLVTTLLARDWLPLGPGAGDAKNLLLVASLVGFFLLVIWCFRLAYRHLLTWALDHKLLFASLPALAVLLGLSSWLGFDRVTAYLPESVRTSELGTHLSERFPGLGSEFMPQLDEGSFLYMPSTMSHASIGEGTELLALLDRRIEAIPEVAYAVGKLGRADSPLDPAPLSMVETLIEYLPEFRQDEEGRRLRFRTDDEGEFVRDEAGELIEDPDGLPYRNWRSEIRSPRDIWDEVVDAARIPGLTSAPLLQPISTRIVMLQSGIRAPMAVRLRGPDLTSLQDAALAVEALLREHPLVYTPAVIADRPVGKPYLEITPNRAQMARHGVTMAKFQDTVEVAIGGRAISYTVEGRERYPIRVRYPRESRSDPEQMLEVLVDTARGTPVPLGQLATVVYRRGPQTIRSEDSYLVSYVMFDREPDVAEMTTIDGVRTALDAAIASGELTLPEGVSYELAGSYENNVRAAKRLALIVPIALVVVFLLLYFQFSAATTALMVFGGIAVAFAGGFIALWAYGQPWFLDVHLFGTSLRELFHVRPLNMSVATWVGFIALFGIATDDGVVMATYLEQRFARRRPDDVASIRAEVLVAAQRRVRPALMTTATTILALLPVLSAVGTGADIMVPMAVPIVGGMAIELLTLFAVPVLFSFREESKARAASLRGKE